MMTEHISGLTVRITGGSDGDGGGDGPLTVLLHGFGAPGTDLVPLARELPASHGMRFAFPAAPLTLADGFFEARAWWMIDWERRERMQAQGRPLDLSDEAPEGLASARQRVTELIHSLAERLAPPPGGVVLGGFSQGAMLACDVALHTELPVAGLVLLSPTLIARAVWAERLARRRGLPVFMSHGRADPVLPFSMSERLRDLLSEGGLAVTWVPFGGGHEIPAPVLGSLGRFLEGVVAPRT